MHATAWRRLTVVYAPLALATRHIARSVLGAPVFEAGVGVLRKAEQAGAAVCSSVHQSPLANLPRPVLVLLALACLGLAAVVAGLTLGMMSLDAVGLEILNNAAPSEADQRAAQAIIPVRKNGNLLLVTLLLTNTIAMEFLPLVLETLFPGGLVALIMSVVLIMIFSEILPQATFARYALRISAFFVPFVKILIMVLYPFSAPIAYLLDKLLGNEKPNVYSKEELKELLHAHTLERYGELTLDEMSMLRGTLDFANKSASDIMTKEKDVFMLSVDEVLDRKTMEEIMEAGYSRIPLYQNTRANVVALLLTKQLIMYDPDEELEIVSLIRKKKKNAKIRVAPPLYASQHTKLSDLLNEFQLGRSHMAIVYDDLNKKMEQRTLMGVVTLEDIIEEILQEEIVDESDAFLSNDAKIPVLRRDLKSGRLTRGFVGPALVTTKKIKGTSAIVLHEIDVKQIKKKMLAKMEFRMLETGSQGMTSAESSMAPTPRDAEHLTMARQRSNTYSAMSDWERTPLLPK
ncbi:Metal transporter CNNM4 [Porphyridium purpureum]|uniref:Metal transporter CNNM4 n=1 Tax=Porphyridium purpureum TaxID=35688 RepID=A0A5J4YQ10_PORPP|nr:Metal transporter CNNM4 [Porphyridium purpureum]|eukprot:POR3054..scf236_6